MPFALRPTLLAALVLLFLSGSAFAAPIGLTIHGSELVTIDLEDGASDRIAFLGFEPAINALDTAADGTLYALEVASPTTSRLLQINHSTGATTVIGEVGSEDARGMAFDGTGRLFVADDQTLLEVDPVTAAAMPVLDMGANVRALAASDGNLYGIRRVPGAECELILIEPDLGDITQVIPTVRCGVSADGRDGVLWLVSTASPILGLVTVGVDRVDLASGTMERTGTWSGLFGQDIIVIPGSLADVGNPSFLPTVDIPALDGAALALFALALAAAALIRGRHRRLG